MKTARLFKHGGSQAVRLPKDFRLEGTEVLIERRGEVVLLRPKARMKTLADLARHMRARFPAGSDFPSRQQPKAQQKRELRFDESPWRRRLCSIPMSASTSFEVVFRPRV